MRATLIVLALAAATLGCGNAATSDDNDSPAASANAKGTGTHETHPMQQWMKANASTAMNAANYDKLATVLDRAAGFGPEGAAFASWSRKRLQP